ncbi:serine/threonine protein kinase [Myxococcota bacterium]|nr:serine/threonine protein kinase [Myxococcota bacterium]
MEGERLGRYRLVRRLATGGMAEVFLAVAEGPEGFRKVVVVKRVLPHFSEDPRFAEMFLDEARLAARLEHPNIVQIFDLGEADGRYFIAMEFLRGLPVSQVLRRLRARGREFPHPLAAWLLARAAQALHYAHRLQGPDGRPLGIVHRDISPDNLFLTREGVVKVLDFGIAKAATHRHETAAGTVKGKFAYMSPEQVRGQPLDARSDVFSLGVVLYELTTSARPFGGASDLMTVSSILNDPPPRPAEVFPGYDPLLEAVCLRCLEKDRDRRFGSAGELAEALAPLAGGTATEAALAALVEDLATDEEKARWDRPVEEGCGEATVLLEGPGETRAQGTPGEGAPPGSRGGEGGRPGTGGAGVPAEPAAEALSGRTLQIPSSVENPVPAVPGISPRRSGGPRRTRTLAVVLGIFLGAVAAGGGAWWAWQQSSEPTEVSGSSPPAGMAPEPSRPAEPSPTRLVVTSLSSATVEVDGRVCGLGRCELAVAPGAHRVRVRGAGFQRDQEVAVPEGRTTEVEVRPPPGSLVLKVPAGVEVFLDGDSVGRGPFIRPVQTWQGVHTVRFVPPRGDPAMRSVTIPPENPQVTLTWP